MEKVRVKLLLDQNLSHSLASLLSADFPETSHVGLCGLETSDDIAVWDFAKQHGYVIVSKDEDFHLLSFARGHPPKVIWLRSGNGPVRQVLGILLQAKDTIREFGEDPRQALLVLA